jgi:cell division protein FtsN
MAKIEPGTYEPRGDDIRVFDGAEDDMDEEGSRLPLLIVIALLVLAAFGGVVYLAYTEGVQKGHSDAPRVITAEAGPAKVAPTDAGGSETPYKGLKIYEQPAPSDEDADSAPPPPTQVAPAPQTSAPPATFAQAKPTPTTTSAPPTTQPAQQKPAPSTTIAAQTKPSTTVAATTPKPAPAKLAPTTKPETATAAPRSLTPAATQPGTAKPAPVEAKPAPVTTTAAATGGAYVLQIGSYKSQAEATSAFDTLKRKNGALMSGFSANVKEVDLGDKGTWYRLRVGSFADKDAAAALCQRLGGGCFPAKP